MTEQNALSKTSRLTPVQSNPMPLVEKFSGVSGGRAAECGNNVIALKVR